LRKAVMARQSPLPDGSKPRGSVVGEFAWKGGEPADRLPIFFYLTRKRER